MNDANDQREIEALIQAYLDDSLAESEGARLLTFLRCDPALVNVIVESLRTDCLIRNAVAESAQALAEVNSSPKTVVLLPMAEPVADRSRRRTLFTARWRATVALAACLALLLGLSGWYFSPTMGAPVLTAVSLGTVTLERTGQTIAATVGMPLQSGDVVRTATNATATIGFGREPTRFEVRAETELKLDSFANAKRFTLRSGKVEASVARQRPFKPMLLRTTQAEARVLGTKFTLTATTTATRLEVAEGQVQLTRASDGTHVKVPGGYYTIAADITELSVLPNTGSIRREIWTGISGGEVNDLLDHPHYPNRPNYSDKLKAFETPVSETNNYACRIIGYLHPPITGDYTFWIASGGNGSLWLSPDENPTGKVRIATTPGGLLRNWQDSSTKRNNLMMPRSPPIQLLAGRRYFIQAIEKAATNSSHLEVAWKRPDAEREIISGDFLSPFTSKSKVRPR